MTTETKRFCSPPTLPSRSRHRRLVACFVGALISCQASPLSAQKAVSVKDSINALNRAIQGLRQLEGFYTGIQRSPATTSFDAAAIPGGAACEIQIADYCYGPRNGGLAFGGVGTRPASGRFRQTKYELQNDRLYTYKSNRYRDSLLKSSKTIPRDRFINGELVRLPIERANYIAAMANLSNCQVDDWWCTAMRAFVIHVAGSRARADSVWDKVVALMPPLERCAWLDPSWISSDEHVARSIRQATCSERERLAHRAWWLSDPLYFKPGNERRSEHLARNTELMLNAGYMSKRFFTPAMVLRGKSPPSDSSVLYYIRPEVMLKYPPWIVPGGWGYDELVMRAGPPHFFARGDGVIVAQYPFPRESFVPNGRLFTNHLSARAEDWKLHDPWAFEFMNGYSAPISELQFQLAWFRRGDSARVVVATDIRDDSVLTSLKPEAALFFQRDFDQPVQRERGTLQGGQTYRYAFAAGRDSTLASIEVVGRNLTAARARFGTGPQTMPAQRVTLSDLLLTLSATALPTSLEEATEISRSRTTIADSAVGVFWEMYGVNSADSVSVELVSSRVRTGGVAGLLRGIFGGGGDDSVAIRWSEPPRTRTTIEPRAINLNLAALRPAKYVVSIAVDVPGQQRVVSRREIEILRRR